MINYNGDFEARENTTVETLPAGAYIGKVLGAKVEPVTSNGRTWDRLVLQLDVTEGQYANHYQNLYKSQQGGQFAAKYKGVLRLNIPVKGDQYEGMNKRILEGAVWCLEDSNAGFKWNWDETKLKGLSVGFSVRDMDYLIEDASGIRTGTTTEIARLESVKKIKAGEVKPVKRRELKEAQKQRLQASTAAAVSNAQPVQDDELPF